MEIVYSLINQILLFFEKSRYLGIFFLMALESTLVPIPSEVIIPPAAYLAYKGNLSLLGVIVSGTLGSLAGSLCNYFIGLKVGRPIFLSFIKRYGKFLLLTEKGFYRIEKFWENHGHISTFIGRLLPGFRHVISIPAGFAKMNLYTFSFFTTFGASIWCTFLAFCGYLLGKNEALLKEYLHKGSYGFIILCAILVMLYMKFKLKRLN